MRCVKKGLDWVKLVVVAIAAGTITAHGQTIVLNPGMASSVAGNGSTSYSPATYTGPALSAGLNFPRRIVRDTAGNLYWIEKGGQIARVLASGNGAIPALPGVSAPVAGNLYTVAGNGGTAACTGKTDAVGDGCPATQAYMTGPYGIAVDSHGNVYLDDSSNFLVRVVYAGGTVPNLPASPVVGNIYAIAGTGTSGGAGDGGPGLNAQIGVSHGVAVDPHGNVYFTDSTNQSIRVLYASGTIPGITSPVAGSVYTLTGGVTPGVCTKATLTCGDGGPALAGQIDGPDAVGVDALGNIYFGDTGDLRVRAIFVAGALPGIASPVSGYIYTVAGNGVSGSGPDGVQATASSLTSGMAEPFIDSVGNLYVPDATSNRIRKIDPSGIITTVFGAATVCPAHTNAAGDGCPTNQATLNSVSGVVLDPDGNAYIADYKNNLIRLLTPTTTSLNFTGAVGATIAKQTVIVSNGGMQMLTLSGVTFSGPFAQAASGGTDCGSATMLAAGASCQITISAQATSAGSSTGSVTIASNATNATAGKNTIALTAALTLGATTTSLSVAPGALVNVGQQVTFTAIVSPSAGVTLSPGGTVTFLNGSTSVGSATLAGGKAAFTTGSLAAGTYNIIASYGGDGNFNGSVSPASPLTVSASPVPTVTLTASAASVPAKQTVTLTATVTQYMGAQVPAGTVKLMEGSNVLAEGTVNGEGVFSAAVPVAAGLNSIFVAYAGDGTFLANTSSVVTVKGTVGAQLALYPGKILTVAGSHTLGAGYSGDGSAAASAQVKTPLGLGMDSAGNLFIADSGNNRIRRVDAATGSITTVVGTGTACSTALLPCGDGSAATAALLSGPQGVRVDANGNLYILDRGDHAIRKVTASTGVITTVAGTLGMAGYAGDGLAATSAKLNGPRGFYLDNEDNLYIGDSGNAVVRRVDAVTGVITTIAGTGSALGDGGAATSAQLINPRGIAQDSAGNLYIADMNAYRVRRIDAQTGLISTVAGTGTACSTPPCGDGGAATSAGLDGPQDVAVDAAGDLFITDPNINAVRRVNAAGVISMVAGQQSTTAGYLADGAASTSGLLSYPNSLLLDAQGNLYISEANNSLVRTILAAGSSLSFGSLSLGTSANQTVTAANTGDQPVTITGISAAAGFSQQPSGSPDCTANVALSAGSNCLLDIQFAPVTAGATTGTVNIASNAANAVSGEHVITLSGTGTGFSGTTAQTITFGSLPNVTYGAAPIALSAAASSGLAVTFNSVTGPAVLNGSTLKIIGAGTVSVTAYQFGSATYAAAAPVTQSFIVSPATLTFTANDATRAVGVANPAFTYTVTGFVAGDTQSAVTGTPSLATAATMASPAGPYAITISAGTVSAANYVPVFVNGTLHVTGLAQTIIFNALPDITYGAAAFALTASSSSSLPVSYSVTGPASVSGSMLTITGTGAVTVMASQAGDTTYAAATPVAQSFQVAPAVLTVTATDASRVVGAANPAFTYTVSGLVHGDTATVVSGTPAFSTTATQSSPLGHYPITVSAGTLQAVNYTFQFSNGTLTITATPPDYSISSNLSSLTLQRGIIGHLTLTVTPVSNFNGAIAFSCGTLPTGVTCAFAPASLSMDGAGNPMTVALAVDTSATLAAIHAPSGRERRRIVTASFFWLPCVMALLITMRMRQWLRPAARVRQLTALMVLLGGLALAAGATGCGAGKSYVAPVVTTVTVTAASGALTHTTTFNLTLI